MTSTSPGISPAPRYRGLDGLRALAVILVVLYHLFPVAPAGFIGVDVFFVISGFLITSLLLREHASTGRIRLGEFWRRRARRLLPALGLVVTVCSTLALVVGGDVLVRLGAQVAGAFTFSYNWLSIAAGTGYFADAAPELFRNFWSLAVEEQFYLLWPLVLPLFLLLPRTWMRAGAALVLAAASAGWMLSLAGGAGDATRAYFGTDTHSFGILLGVALAFMMRPVLAGRAAWAQRPGVRAATGLAGAAAVGGIVLLAVFAPPDLAGALISASILSAVAIVGGAWPRSWLGPAIDVAPLRWVGDRSYGIYLWHWPLLVLALAAAEEPAGAVPPTIGVWVLVTTAVAAALSYRWIEWPIRRDGFRVSLRRLVTALVGRPRSRMRALACIAVAALMLGGTSAALAAAPGESSGESAVAAGEAALEKAADTPAALAAPTRLVATPAAMPVTGDQITAVGDSVMLASAPALLEKLPGIQVDAAVSRSVWKGPDILRSLADAGRLRPYVVIALGTNGPVEPEVLQQMAAIAGPDRELILVNAYAPRDWIPGVNAELAAFDDAHRDVVVADWAGAIGAHPDLLAGDGIHPGPEGGRVFADVVARTVDEVRRQRAQLQYEVQQRLYEKLTVRR